MSVETSGMSLVTMTKRLVVVAVGAVCLALVVNQWVVPELVRRGLGDAPTEGTDSVAVPVEPSGERSRRGVGRRVGDLLAPAAEAAEPRVQRARQVAEPSVREPKRAGETAGQPSRPDPTPAEPGSGTESIESKPTRESAESAEPAQFSGPTVVNLDRRELNRRLEKPEEIAERLVVRPIYDDADRSAGLEIVTIAGDYSRLGLRRGDVLLAVNGRTITNQWRAIEHLQSMKERRVFDFTVERDGAERTFRYVVD